MKQKAEYHMTKSEAIRLIKTFTRTQAKVVTIVFEKTLDIDSECVERLKNPSTEAYNHKAQTFEFTKNL